MQEIDFKDWKMLDLKVGEIKKAEQHPNADKLVVLKVDTGGKEIQLVAGIKQQYTAKELIGKKIVVFTNLKPVELRGIKSEGMILAAVDKGADKIALLTVDKDIKNGARIE